MRPRSHPPVTCGAYACQCKHTQLERSYLYHQLDDDGVQSAILEVRTPRFPAMRGPVIDLYQGASFSLRGLITYTYGSLLRHELQGHYRRLLPSHGLIGGQGQLTARGGGSRLVRDPTCVEGRWRGDHELIKYLSGCRFL